MTASQVTATREGGWWSLVAHDVLALRREVAELSDRVHRQTPAAVAELRAAGLTVRDVAQLLGVTPSQVSQIENRDHLISSA
ncbi:MAG: helix-turn-helix domain-containing protein [Nitriliruptoraceae bacterium]